MRLPAVFALATASLVAAGHAAAQEPFTTWPNVLKPGATVVVGGVSQEFTYAAGPSGVTSVAPPSTNVAVSLTEPFDASGDLSAVILKNANRTVSFYKSNGDTLTRLGDGTLIYARASDWTRQALTVDAMQMGWTYQTFAVWQEGLGMPTGSMGAASVGAITAGASVPQTGSALFAGLMAGIFNDSIGQDHVVAADMFLLVNFAGHNASFATFNTADRTGRGFPELNITGTFLSLANHPALFGTLFTQRLTGTSSAQFYGPGAEEVGGVFTLTPISGSGLERLAGAFGGARATTPPATFVSWASALQPGVTASVGGRAIEVAVTGGVAGVGSVTPSEVYNTTYTETISTAGITTGLSIAARNRSVGFNTANGDRLVGVNDSRLFGAISADQGRVAVSVDPFAVGWNYQQFGAWQSTDSPTTGGGGVFSVGAATPGSQLPTGGSATFTGLAGGIYIGADGIDHMVAASATVTADFAARSAKLTSGVMTDLFESATYSGSELSGTLTYAAGQNALSGTLATANGRLSGTANAQFFGPLAQEIGGVFLLAPASGVERLIGGFGAKR